MEHGPASSRDIGLRRGPCRTTDARFPVARKVNDLIDTVVPKHRQRCRRLAKALPCWAGVAVALTYRRRLSIKPILFVGQCSPGRFHSLVPLPRWLIGGTFREVGAVLCILPVCFRLLHGCPTKSDLRTRTLTLRATVSATYASASIGSFSKRQETRSVHLERQHAREPFAPVNVWVLS